jgi:hypothetical protein
VQDGAGFRCGCVNGYFGETDIYKETAFECQERSFSLVVETYEFCPHSIFGPARLTVRRDVRG